MVTGRERAIALDGLAHLGAPSPLEVERRLAKAWDLFASSGAPEDPAWAAVAHDLGEGLPDRKGAAYREAQKLLEVADTHAGIVIWAGGVGSGRSYAAAWMLWRMAQRVAAGERVPMGRWIDAPELGSPGQWRDRGSTARTWPEILDTLTAPKLVIIDDVGAEGTTPKAAERASELLQRRFRRGGLTLVTTNAPLDSHLALFGGRVLSRADRRWLPGGDRRGHRLVPTPKTPARVAVAIERLRAADELDRATRLAQWGQRSERVADYVSEWLRGDKPASAWARTVDAHARVIAAREAELASVMVKACESLATPPDPGPSEDETARLRAAHQAKLVELARAENPDTLRESLARLEHAAKTPTELAAVEAIKSALG